MISKELTKRLITSLVLLPIVIFLIITSKELFILLLLIVTVISFSEWFFINKKKISILLLLGYLVISLSILSAYFLRGNNTESIVFFLWVISICLMSDIGGYFFGKNIGGKKLTKISPNKTYSGMFGSFFLSLAPIFCIYFFEFSFIELRLSTKYVILSLILCLICQIGDIIVSYFKRLNKVKDTGKLLPGHGGLLDRIDGLIFVMIFSNFLKFFNII